MTEHPIDVTTLPICLAQKLRECLGTRRNSFTHEGFGVGLHQRLHPAGDRFVATAVTETMVRRVGAGRGGQQSIAGAAEFRVDQHQSHNCPSRWSSEATASLI